MDRDLFTSDRLFCPGPTPVPKDVLAATSETSVYHRSEEFYKVFRACMEGLKPVFGSATLPLILTASGSGALEAAMVNLTAPGDQVVVVNGGKFGERWEKLAKAYQCETAVVSVEWGQAPAPEGILSAIRSQGNTRAVFLQGNETSTGAYYPVEKIAKTLRASGFKGFLIVDCISALCAHTMRMDEWGIDAVVAGSQKGFGLPPGLAFIALSEHAWGNLSTRPRFYFDLAKERKGQEEGRSAWTPATTLIFGLQKALETMNGVGIDKVVAHHTAMANATRAAVKAIHLELFAGTAPSNALTSITVPKGIDGTRLLKRLRQRFGMFFAGGQDELKGKIIRFSHLGFITRFDVIDGIAALEFALREEGYAHDLGTGVKAAMEQMTKGS